MQLTYTNYCLEKIPTSLKSFAIVEKLFLESFDLFSLCLQTIIGTAKAGRMKTVFGSVFTLLLLVTVAGKYMPFIKTFSLYNKSSLVGYSNSSISSCATNDFQKDFFLSSESTNKSLNHFDLGNPVYLP